MQIMRQPRIEAEYGIPKSTLYYWEMQNLFPKRVKIGTRAVGWIGEEISAVMKARSIGSNDEAIRKLVGEMTAARSDSAE